MNPLWWANYPLRLVRPGIPGVDYSIELTMKKEPAADAANTTGMPSSQEPVQDHGRRHQTHVYGRHGAEGAPRPPASDPGAEGAPRRPWPPTSDPGAEGAPRRPWPPTSDPGAEGAPRRQWPPTSDPEAEGAPRRQWPPTSDPEAEGAPRRPWPPTSDRACSRSPRGRGKGERLHRVWQPFPSSSRSHSTSPAADLGELL